MSEPMRDTRGDSDASGLRTDDPERESDAEAGGIAGAIAAGGAMGPLGGMIGGVEGAEAADDLERPDDHGADGDRIWPLDRR